jgi:Kef-type K+ transport system membrane component KefB
MTPTLLRFAYVCEFLLALIAIFTAWSEIGGQAALDVMHWGWKLGFGVALSAGAVGYTAAIVGEEKIGTVRAARWLVAILVITMAMGVVTYYYAVEAETGESDEPSGTVSIYAPWTPNTGDLS